MSEEIKKKYDDPNSYPNEIRPIVTILLQHEAELTGDYTFTGDEEDEADQKAAREFLTVIATEILTATKKMLENQYPLWELKNGQFTPANRQNESRTTG